MQISANKFETLTQLTCLIFLLKIGEMILSYRIHRNIEI